MKTIILFFFILLSSLCSAQNLIDSSRFYNNTIYDIEFSGDTIWFGTKNGLVQYSNSKCIDIPLENEVYNILVLKNELLYFYRNKIFSYYKRISFPITGARNDIFVVDKAICADTLYVAMSDAKVYYAKLENEWITTNFLPLNLPSESSFEFNQIHKIFIDSFGKLWICTDMGAFYWKNNKFEKVINEPIYAIAEHELKVYLAGRKNIITYFNNKSGIYYNSLNFNISEIKFDSGGHLWMLSDTTLLTFCDSKILKICAIHDKVKNIKTSHALCMAINNSDKTIWVGTEGRGLFLFDLTKNEELSCPSNSIEIGGELIAIDKPFDMSADILFDADSCTLDTSNVMLHEIREYLIKNQKIYLDIRGYISVTPEQVKKNPKQYENLPRCRANSVRDYLLRDKKIDANRITAGAAEDLSKLKVPLDPNDSKNRRVEFIFKRRE